ncbi:MAG: DUF5676 family membrane protein [Patescibacteria group bacterium]
MELDKNKFALAAAGTVGIWYLICATLVATVPNLALTLFSWLVHLVNLEPATLTWTTFFAGLVEILILSYLTALVFAWLHNKFVTKTQ